MNFILDREQSAIQNAVRKFLENEAKNIARETEDTEKGYSFELWQKMAQLGWMGVSFPEKYGGSGGDFLDLVLILEEMGKTLIPGPFIPAILCSGHTILKYGNEIHKKELLPKIINGSLLIIPALINPVSDTVQVSVKENVKIAKDNYIISGIRLFVPYVHVAEKIIYRTKYKERDIFFMIDTKSSGVSYNHFNTIGSDKQYELVLDKVIVSTQNIIGEAKNQGKILKDINEWGALAHCGYILGILEQILKMSVEYAKQRVQFEKQIGSFQIIQHQCADMATDIEKVKWLTYQAAWMLSKDLEATKAISMAKAKASDACRRVSLLGIKIHGGLGIMVDQDMQIYFRKAKAAELAFGDGDYHREIVAEQLDL